MNLESFKKNISEFRKVGLSFDEKDFLKQRVISQMKAVELRAERQRQSKILLPGSFFHPRVMAPLVFGFIFIVSGGSVLAAAGKAMPGDFLYPVKTEINERLAGAFDFSQESKALREAKLIDRRLQETQIIIADGRFSQEARDIVESRLEQHVGKIKTLVSALEQNGQFEKLAIVQDRLDISLKANDKILSSLEVTLGEVAPVAPKAREDLASITIKRQSAPENQIVGFEVDLSATAKERQLRARRAVEEVENLLKRQKNISGDFSGRLSQIKKDFEEGLILLEVKSNRQAIETFDLVFRSASELKLLLEASYKLPVKIDFSKDSTDDDLGILEPEKVEIIEAPIGAGSVKGEFQSKNQAIIGALDSELKSITRPQ